MELNRKLFVFLLISISFILVIMSAPIWAPPVFMGVMSFCIGGLMNIRENGVLVAQPLRIFAFTLYALLIWFLGPAFCDFLADHWSPVELHPNYSQFAVTGSVLWWVWALFSFVGFFYFGGLERGARSVVDQPGNS